MEPANEYEVRLTADRTQLPLNLESLSICNSNTWPSPTSAYATALYVEAFRKGTNDPIPGGEEVFSCVVQQGIESASLYHFRGREEEEVVYEVDCDGDGEDEEYAIEGAYRSITLGANAGGASFHMISKDKVGAALVRCTATDPQSGTQSFAEITVQVGGASTGRPAQIRVTKVDMNDRTFPRAYLYPQGLNDPTMLRVQAELLDEAGQRVNAGAANNLRACLIGPSTTQGYLQAGGMVAGYNPANSAGGCANGVTTRSINGMAEFSVHSGSTAEILLVRIETDRADNNVDNGLAEPIYNIVTVPVVFVQPTAFSVFGGSAEIYKGDVSALSIPISGGFPPYTCQISAGSGLPAGLSLADCAISGNPTVPAGTYAISVDVRDSAVQQSQGKASITLTIYDPLVITTSSLPPGIVGEAYNVTVVATGGKAPLTYAATGLPPGLTIDTATGVISGTPTTDDNYSVTVTVTDANGRSVSKALTLAIAL